jgi:radical SAM-linked protein
MDSATPVPGQGTQLLQEWQRLITSGTPGPAACERLLGDLEREHRLEHAWMLLKQARLDAARWGGLQARLKAMVDQARERRMNQWQNDPRRRTLRLRFTVQTPAAGAHPAGLLALLARALLAAGLPVAMGLEKSPRPAIRLGHPLPASVPGDSEWADLVLLEGPGTPLAELPTRINAHMPAGLRVLECVQVPNHASPVADLCRLARWRWTCPDPQARAKVEAFIHCERFEIDKPGKVAGEKAARRVDLRPLLEDLRWEGDDLLFQTRIAPGEAANPGKYLLAILGREAPSGAAGQGVASQGLARIAVELGEDPRLAQGGRFEPKLHNMYEDATLLTGGDHIRIVEEDDDEPILLG